MNDIALIKLPSGQEFIVAAYSDSYESTQPYPYDGSNLGAFIYILLDKLKVLDGPCAPPIITLDTSSTSFETNGNWIAGSSNQALSNNFLQVTNDVSATASWSVDIPATGLYEVAIWSPQSNDFSDSTTMVVNSYTGKYTFHVSQQSYGGRWYKLGDFYFTKGEIAKCVTIRGSSDSTVVANAIKISQWPECNDSPGATCQDFNPSDDICRM